MPPFQHVSSGQHVQEEKNTESDTLQPQIQSDPLGKPTFNTEPPTEILAELFDGIQYTSNHCKVFVMIKSETKRPTEIRSIAFSHSSMCATSG